MTEQIEAVQRMQDYIESHCAERITMAELAAAALYSPWYAYRLFTQHTGLTPSDYVRKLRLSKSALLLRDEPHKIAEVAFALGFGSVDGYQRSFRREFGCNPAAYASNPVPLQLFIPYGVKFRYLERKNTMSQLKNVFIQVVEKPARQVILKRSQSAGDYWAYCQEVGCEVWGVLRSIRSVSGEPVSMWLPHHLVAPNTGVYVQGVEVAEEEAASVPDGFDIISLPAASYLMFQGEPFAEEDYCQAIEELQAAIKKYDPSMTGYVWDQDNPRIQLEPVGSRGYIELLPVLKKESVG